MADHNDMLLAGPSGLFSEYYLYEPDVDGEDLLTFAYCVVEDTESHDVDDGFLGGSTTRYLGTGEAHRVDGAWRLHEFGESTVSTDRDPEVLQSGACKAEVETLPDLNEDSELEEAENE